MWFVPVSKRRDEVQTAVNSVVQNVLSVQSTLVSEVLLKLLVNVVCDGPPTAHKHTFRVTFMSAKDVGLGNLHVRGFP